MLRDQGLMIREKAFSDLALDTRFRVLRAFGLCF